MSDFYNPREIPESPNIASINPDPFAKLIGQLGAFIVSKEEPSEKVDAVVKKVEQAE